MPAHQPKGNITSVPVLVINGNNVQTLIMISPAFVGEIFLSKNFMVFGDVYVA